MWLKLLFLAAAGGLGTLTRFGLTELTGKLFGSAYPLGTLSVNVLGCFVAGFFITALAHRFHPDLKLIALTGFMGAFTTFSAYILEAGEMAKTSGWLVTAGHLFLHNGFGLAGFFLGSFTGLRLTV